MKLDWLDIGYGLLDFFIGFLGGWTVVAIVLYIGRTFFKWPIP